MRTSFSGLEMLRQALHANQWALEVVGQNVANANTRGYSRQEISLYAAAPLNVPLGPGLAQIGAGVSRADLVRYREEFFDRQYRQRSADNAGAGAWARVFEQVETVFGAGEGDLQGLLDRFWRSLQGLANRPDEADARVAVREAARTLVQGAQAMYTELSVLQRNLDDDLVLKAERVNQIAAEVAALNHDILRAEGSGVAPNGLTDKRDMLLDELSRLTGAAWVTASNGQVTVSIGSMVLVMGESVNRLVVNRPPLPALSTVTWQQGGMTVTFAGGELAAQQQARDSTIPEYQGYIQNLMGSFMAAFNAQHQAGYTPAGATGIDFFTYGLDVFGRVDMGTIQVLTDVSQIAAAAGNPPAAGDGENARLLSGLFDQALVTDPLTGAGPVSVMSFNRALMGQLGVQVNKYRSQEETTGLQLRQAENVRLSVSGVSLDEEMAKMIQFQHTYAAASRMVTTLDETLETLVNRTGLVGR